MFVSSQLPWDGASSPKNSPKRKAPAPRQKGGLQPSTTRAASRKPQANHLLRRLRDAGGKTGSAGRLRAELGVLPGRLEPFR
jgi:hypothetical protein